MLNFNVFGGWCCGCGWFTAGSAISENLKFNKSEGEK